MATIAPDRPQPNVSTASNTAFKKQLNKVYAFYTGGFIAFVIVLAILEQMGLNRDWIGFIFLLATIGLYAGIGIMSRTTDAAEYYVAGRRVRSLQAISAPGTTQIPFDGRDDLAQPLASGIYFLRAREGTRSLTAKFVLVR